MAEGIIVTCPSCQIQLQAQSDFAGQSVRCPRCNGKVPVPAMAQDIVPAATTRRGLNRAQMKVLFVAAAALVVMVLVPPWRMKQVQMQRQRSSGTARYTSWQTVKEIYGPGGYAPLWSPPEGSYSGGYSNIHTDWQYCDPAGIDIYRLGLQIVGLVAVTGGAAYALRRASGTGSGIVQRSVRWVARHAFILGAGTAIVGGAVFAAWRAIGHNPPSVGGASRTVHAFADGALHKVLYAKSGDTLVVEGNDLTAHEVRICGIDAPPVDLVGYYNLRNDPYYSMGPTAQQRLARLVEGQQVKVVRDKDDRSYGYYVELPNNRDVGFVMLSVGLVRVSIFRPFTRVAGYVEAERVAKQGKLGIWRQEAQDPLDALLDMENH